MCFKTGWLQSGWLPRDPDDMSLAPGNDPALTRHVGDRGIRAGERARDAMRRGATTLHNKSGHGLFWVAPIDDSAVEIRGLCRRAGLDEPDFGCSRSSEYCGYGCARAVARAVMEHADLAFEPTAWTSLGNTVSTAQTRKHGAPSETILRMAGDDQDNAVHAMSLAARSNL